MFYELTRKIFRFVGIFVLVVVALYLDKLVVYPIKTVKEIFEIGFPWNLIILTIMIYSLMSIVFGIKSAFSSHRRW